jgi:hypothetical protein
MNIEIQKKQNTAIVKELAKATLSFPYFTNTFCKIDDPNKAGSAWFPFELWPAQFYVAEEITKHQKLILLKARQLGFTWLCIAYALWLMLFRPGSVILMFSRTGLDAEELIRRLTGMYANLPEWIKANNPTSKQLTTRMELQNQSRAIAFTTTKHSGRSFTATFVLVDEAAYIDFLNALLNATGPTIDAGGQLALISTANKEKPHNTFHRLFKEAEQREYNPIFLPWSARPSRTTQWYLSKQRTTLQDDLWQEYPANPAEALAGRQAGRRYNIHKLAAIHKPQTIISENLGISELTLYKKPRHKKHKYIVGIDTSGGDLKNDPSAAIILDPETLEEMGILHGPLEPSILAHYLVSISQFYNDAILVVERNNHGHAVILALQHAALTTTPNGGPIYVSPFDRKKGWLSNAKYKTLAINNTAELINEESPIIHSDLLRIELGSIETKTLEAIPGEHDDTAMAFSLALAGIKWPGNSGGGGYQTTARRTVRSPKSLREAFRYRHHPKPVKE